MESKWPNSDNGEVLDELEVIAATKGRGEVPEGINKQNSLITKIWAGITYWLAVKSPPLTPFQKTHRQALKGPKNNSNASHSASHKRKWDAQ